MYSYIKGNITEVKPKYITVEAYGVGYMVIVSNPYDYKLDQETKVYIHQHVREDAITLFGFKSNEEKELFLKLLSVNGIGPKSALSILAGDVNKSLQAIENADVSYFKKFPGIGPKASQQIIFDLKGKVNFTETTPKLDELKDVLTALGYKDKEISKILPKLDDTKDTNDLVKDALTLLR